jgi:hypothetical protein
MLLLVIVVVVLLVFVVVLLLNLSQGDDDDDDDEDDEDFEGGGGSDSELSEGYDAIEAMNSDAVPGEDDGDAFLHVHLVSLCPRISKIQLASMCVGVGEIESV